MTSILKSGGVSSCLILAFLERQLDNFSRNSLGTAAQAQVSTLILYRGPCARSGWCGRSNSKQLDRKGDRSRPWWKSQAAYRPTHSSRWARASGRFHPWQGPELVGFRLAGARFVVCRRTNASSGPNRWAGNKRSSAKLCRRGNKSRLPGNDDEGHQHHCKLAPLRNRRTDCLSEFEQTRSRREIDQVYGASSRPKEGDQVITEGTGVSSATWSGARYQVKESW